MNLYSELEIEKMLLKNGITNPKVFIEQLTPEQDDSDSKSNELLLKVSATILAGIIANEGVSNSAKEDQVEASLKYTHLLIQKIDNVKKD